MTEQSPSQSQQITDFLDAVEEKSHDDEPVEPSSAQLKNNQFMPNSLGIDGFDVVADDSMNMSNNSPRTLKYAATEIELRTSYDH